MIQKKINTLGDFAREISKAYGDLTAIKIRPRFRAISWTYDDLYRNSLSVANLLKKNHVKKGDRVILWAPNSHLWIASFFAIQLLGAVAVPVNIQNREDFIRKVATQTDSKVIIKSARFNRIGKMKNMDIENIQFNANIRFVPVKTNENDLAEIVYTSGTTGNPKGVMLTHKNILLNMVAASKVITVKQGDRFLSILPLSHMFEQTAGMLIPLYHGCQITYATNLNSINIRRNLIDDRITKMIAVPEFLKIIIRRIESEAENRGKKKQLEKLFRISGKIPSMDLRKILFRSVLKKFGKLDTIASGGAPLEREIGEKWEQMGIYILQGYGATEVSPIVSANGYENRKIDSVGRVIDDVRVKISYDGEILVKGPCVTQGYFKNPEQTKESFADGWYKTGDSGYFDRDGHLHVKGRTKYMIVRGSGENIYPEDIENELNRIDGVQDSCVVGFKRNDNIEVHAVLLGKKIKYPEKIIEDANSKLAPYQQIQGHTVWPFDDFPRTVTRKIMKEQVLSYLESHKVKLKNKTEAHSLVEKIISQIVGVHSGKISNRTGLVSDLKMDSLQRVELVSQIEEETGIIIDESEIGLKTTVHDIKKRIENKKQKIEKYEFNQWPLSGPAMFLRRVVDGIIGYPLVSVFAPHRVEGLENLESLKGPVIFTPNHISAVDSLVTLRAIPPGLRNKTAVAAAIDVTFEKFSWSVPILKFMINIYPFARKGQIKSSLDYTGRLVDRGFSILLFPEGRVSPNGKLQKIKEGSGFIAVEMGVPIVPVKLIGANYVYPVGKKIPDLPNRHDVTVRFGKPIQFSPDTSYIDATRIIEKAMKEM